MSQSYGRYRESSPLAALLEPPSIPLYQTTNPTAHSRQQKRGVSLVREGKIPLRLFFFNLISYLFLCFNFSSFPILSSFLYGGCFSYYLLGVIYLLLLRSYMVVNGVNAKFKLELC